MTQIENDPCSERSESPKNVEQRRHTRHLCIDGGVLRLAVRPEFRGRRAMMVDVSASGIGFILENALDVETVLVFEVKAPNGIDTVSRIARVRHCREHPVPPDAPWLPATPVVSKIFRRLFLLKDSGPTKLAWMVGCEFDRPLSDDEVNQFVAQFNMRAEHGA